MLDQDNINGKYIYNINSTCNTKYTNCIITEVNNQPINDYILSTLSCSKLKYDFINCNPYKALVIFNDSYGTPVELKMITPLGKTITTSMYADLNSEYIFLLSAQFENSSKDTPDTSDQHFYVEKHKDIIYARVNDMSNIFGPQLYKELATNLAKDDSILILDLRGNSGGTIEYTKQFLYMPIFNKTITRTDTAYMISSRNNKAFYNNLIMKYSHNFKRLTSPVDFLPNKNYVYTNTKYEYNGQNTHSCDVYILISPFTASASDHFVSLIKDNNLATIIGTNTAGEGMMGTLFMDVLPNSKLVYLYTPAKAINLDGTDNSTYGTSPDIYCDLTSDSYFLKNELVKDGEDPNTYENRLKWDDVLINTLEIIKEKSNDKTKDTDNK